MINPKADLFFWGPIDGKPIFLDAFHEAISGFPSCYPEVSWPDMIAYFKDDKILYIIEQSEMNGAGLPFFQDYLQGKRSFEEDYKTWSAAANNLEKEADLVDQELSFFEDNELSTKLSNFYDLAIDLWQKEFLAELTNYSGGPYFKEKIFAEYKESAVKILEKLTAPEYRSIFQLEESELCEIRLIKDKKEQEKRLQEHQKRYYWLHNSYGGAEVLSLSYFEDRLEKLSAVEVADKIEKINAYPAKVKKEKEQICVRYNVAPEIVRMAQILCFTTAWQDQQKKHTLLIDHIISKYLAEVGRRKNIPFSNLCFYSLQEIKELINDGRVIDVTERRKSCIVYYEKMVGLNWFSGDEAENLVKPFLQIEVQKDLSELKGMVVSSGGGKITRAVAKILLTPKDISKINEGEILVAPMTSPEYITAMRKASAIVTDVGGITSHAAIISRELGITCIANTKIATRVLKDGDLVEVDADKGTVKILTLDEEKSLTVDKIDDIFVTYRRRAKYYPTYYGETYTSADIQDLIKVKLKYIAFAYRDGFCYFLASKQDWEKFSQQTFKLLLDDPGIIDNYTKKMQREFEKETDSFFSSINKLDEKQTDDLLGELDKIGKLLKQIQLREDTLSCFAESLINKQLKEKLLAEVGVREDIMEIMRGILELDEISFINRELFELAQIAEKDNLQLLQKHFEKWTQFRFDFWGPAVSYDEFYERYLELKVDSGKIKDIITKFENYKQDVRKRKEQLIQKYKLNNEIVLLANLGSRIGLLTDRKKYKITKLACTIDKILELLAHRFGVLKEWFNWMTPEEIKAFTRGEIGFTDQDYKKRKGGSVVFYENGKSNILFDGECFLKIQKIIDADSLNDVKDANGLSAYKGVYRGRAVIINSLEDKSKAVKGMVMLSPKITVDFVHLMKMAGAVVADFGGLASHTAIVAREFKIPTIVDTSNATQIFKDGDLVEVDADKGIVKILKSNKN